MPKFSHEDQDQGAMAVDRRQHLCADLLGRTTLSFCLVEVQARAGEPLDFRFVDANAAFEAQPRLAGAKGQWARTVLPGLGQEVYGMLRAVALTGEAAELECRTDFTGWRPVRLYACRLGHPREKLVGVFLMDMTPGATGTRAQLRPREG